MKNEELQLIGAICAMARFCFGVCSRRAGIITAVFRACAHENRRDNHRLWRDALLGELQLIQPVVITAFRQQFLM